MAINLKTTVKVTNRKFVNGKFHDISEETLKVNIICDSEDSINRDYLQNEYFGQMLRRIDHMDKLTTGHWSNANLTIDDTD